MFTIPPGRTIDAGFSLRFSGTLNWFLSRNTRRSQKMPSSSAVSSVQALPFMPALPVRPERCTNSLIFLGASQLMTALMPLTSKPRPARSVATRISTFLFLRLLMTLSRSSWFLPPWYSATARSHLFLMRVEILSHFSRELTNTMMGPLSPRSILVSLSGLEFSSTSSTCWSISFLPPPGSPMVTQVQLPARYSLPSFSTSGTIVALNMFMIFLSSNNDYSPLFSRMNCRSSDRFSETILSASSITHQLSLCRESWCFSINSLTLPGVPIRISQPLDSSMDQSSNCLPPTATKELRLRFLVNF